jgi:hypothetical protein
VLALLKDVRAVALQPNVILSNAVISAHEKGKLSRNLMTGACKSKREVMK